MPKCSIDGKYQFVSAFILSTAEKCLLFNKAKSGFWSKSRITLAVLRKNVIFSLIFKNKIVTVILTQHGRNYRSDRPARFPHYTLKQIHNFFVFFHHTQTGFGFVGRGGAPEGFEKKRPPEKNAPPLEKTVSTPKNVFQKWIFILFENLFLNCSISLEFLKGFNVLFHYFLFKKLSIFTRGGNYSLVWGKFKFEIQFLFFFHDLS